MMKNIMTVYLKKLFSRSDNSNKDNTSSVVNSPTRTQTSDYLTPTDKLKQSNLDVVADTPSQRKNIPGLNGWLESYSEGLAKGWAYSPMQEVVNVEVLADGVPIGSVPASKYRADLEAAGFGNGNHAFYFNLAEEYRNKNITCRIIGTNFELKSRSKLGN